MIVFVVMVMLMFVLVGVHLAGLPPHGDRADRHQMSWIQRVERTLKRSDYGPMRPAALIETSSMLHCPVVELPPLSVPII